MAEAIDRPQDAAAGSFTPASGGEIGAMPAIASESYRPLSLLALAGFGFAALYALIVVAAGGIALLNHVPCLMPAWSFVLPIAALVLCGLARHRIRNAEGTLSGLAFTAWGIRLTIVVGLSYLAYFGFTFFAVRLQARDFADRFFEQLQQGHTERAYLFANGAPLKDIDDDEGRDTFEITLNTPQGPRGSGPFTQFRQSRFVRTIEMAGGQTRVTPAGVIDWGYEKGGYKVALQYHVATPWVQFDMVVQAFGRDPKPSEPKGRRWQIELRQSDVLSSSVRLTPEGEELMQTASMAQNFALAWQDKVNRQQWDEAYLDTLKPAERERLRKGEEALRLLRTAPLAGLAPLVGDEAASRDFLKGRQALAEGKLLRRDGKTFWASKSERAAIMQRIEQSFRSGVNGLPPCTVQIQQTSMPMLRTHDGQQSFWIDVQLLYPEEGAKVSKYIADGFLVVIAEPSEAGRPPSGWRIEAIELSSARTPPKMSPPPAPGGRPPNAPGGS